MKKLFQTALLPMALMGMTLSSCDKEEGDENDIINLACKISTINSSGFYEDEWGSDEHANETSFTYNGNLLTKVVDVYSYEYCYPDGEGGTFCSSGDGEDEIRFTYNGNQITKISAYEDGVLEGEATVTYANGKISKLTAEYEGEIDELRFTYTNGKISKIEEWDNYYAGSSGNLGLYDYVVYTWTGENVTKEEGYQVYEGEGGRKERKNSALDRIFKGSIARSNPRGREAEYKESVSTYTYDDKQNPFQGSPYVFFDMGAAFFGKNNAVSANETYYYDGGSETDSYTVEYEYNSQGFPISVTEDGDDEPTTITYNCD